MFKSFDFLQEKERENVAKKHERSERVFSMSHFKNKKHDFCVNRFHLSIFLPILLEKKDQSSGFFFN
jgi:hypothetical protein